MLSQILRENVIKNALAVFMALLVAPAIDTLLSVTLHQGNAGDFLVVLSTLLVTVCFANFAFSYEHVPSRHRRELVLLAHAATFLFMLLIGILLVALTVAIKIAYPVLFLPAAGFTALLYVAMVLYDLWDSIRMLNH